MDAFIIRTPKADAPVKKAPVKPQKPKETPVAEADLASEFFSTAAGAKPHLFFSINQPKPAKVKTKSDGGGVSESSHSAGHTATSGPGPIVNALCISTEFTSRENWLCEQLAFQRLSELPSVELDRLVQV